MIGRLVLAALLLGALVLAVEGAGVWTADRSPRRAAPVESDEPSLGLYLRHADPRVGYVLAPSTTHALLESTITTDAHGMRRRAGPSAPDDALVILVVGDSVAFGFGVDDDECLAHRLETLLDDERVRGPDGRRVVCRTVAVPSWNHESPLAFLQHEIERLAPDVVLYLPVHNDLADTSGVTSVGTRREEPVAHAATPLVEVVLGRGVKLERAAVERAKLEGRELSDEELGADALMTGVTPTSRRRYRAAVGSIAALRALSAEHGARFALLRTGGSIFGQLLDASLVREGGEVAALVPSSIPLMRSMLSRFTLGYDPHPNAETLGVWATWIGRELAARGWVDAVPAAPWPDVPSDHEDNRRAPAAVDGLLAGATEHRAAVAARFLSEIDFTSGRGIRQVLGGVNANGLARTGLRVALGEPDGPGATLLVIAAPIESRPDLYPLDVDVTWRGEALGTLTIPPDGLGRFRADLPPRGAGPVERVGELELLPRDWCVARIDARRFVASFRPLRLSIVSR